ncbi:hypothetical protein [Sphingomonas sp. SUN039]|uniref:hypothetical protein n=1 Tax=Sphingomonas sp. SUN039 TaxID=2937787 RepID=UPI0021640E8E|nr:hypothetical protein [Sphingomonas sp. SUN039]UVO52766.1 hypothetical protein M0209_00970 [Sphingomonas sp. SUN039]
MNRPLTIAALVILGTYLLFSLWIAPPHFFVVHAGPNAKSAAFAVVGEPWRSTPLIAGYAVARTDVVEAAAVIAITNVDGSVRRCQFGYFTHWETEPHYLSISECDERWH